MLTAQDFIDKLIPNFWSFLVQLLALIVLVIAAIFLAYKPVKKMLAKRQQYIEDNILEAEKAKANALLAEREAAQILLQKQKEADVIIQNAIRTAEEKHDSIIEKTNLEIESMKEKAKLELEQEIQDTKETIKKEMVEIALEASAQLLKREVSSEDNKRLVDEFIEEIK